MRLNGFDRFCCILAFPVAIVLLVLGVMGLFGGLSVEFTLPPVLGVLPAFVGWGAIKSIRVAWPGSDRGGRFRQDYIDMAK